MDALCIVICFQLNRTINNCVSGKKSLQIAQPRPSALLVDLARATWIWWVKYFHKSFQQCFQSTVKLSLQAQYPDTKSCPRNAILLVEEKQGTLVSLRAGTTRTVNYLGLKFKINWTNYFLSEFAMYVFIAQVGWLFCKRGWNWTMAQVFQGILFQTI